MSSQNVFTPNLNHQKESFESSDSNDQMSHLLLGLMRGTVVLFAFLLPIFFLPGLWASLGFQKSLLALAAVTATITIVSLLMLRQSRVYSVVPMPWLWFGAFVVVASVSAVLSDSPTVALRGSILETQTVAFFALLAGVMAMPLVLQQSKKYAMRTLQAVVAAALLLLVYCVLRLFFGPILPFDSFGAVTTSPFGGFNDLAIFAGLCVLVSLISLLQLPLKLSLQLVLSVVALLSLVVLAAVNFFFVWIIVGFFGLLVLLYVVSRDRLFSDVTETVDAGKSTHPPSYVLTVTTVLVCLVSAWFIIMGDYASSQVSRLFDVDYLEVRPSFSATTDIAQGVYSEQLLFGTGPNQFVSGWRQYKDPSINETLFWSTDFVAGSGYIQTLAVSTGVLGLAALLLFHAWYAWYGLRMLLRTRETDRFWFFVGVISFAGASFLWLMTYLYVPGHTLLLLAAFLTGLSFVAGSALLPETVKSIALVTNRQRGFGLMAAAILLITGSVGILLTVGEQYLAHASFNKAQATADSVAAVDQAALAAYARYQDDSFLGVRARIALLEMNQLLAVNEPTENEQQQFIGVSERALAIANQAIADAPENPEHHAVLAGVFNNLAMAGVPGALERSTSSLESAKLADPENPVYSLLEAQMAVRRGDVESARSALEEALSKKRNFTEALYLLAQLDIAQGNTDAAIETTQAIISLEPANPTRYYQLGILQTAAQNVDQAILAYSTALQLDPDYANARYFRALLLAERGDIEVAVSELKIVQETNQENEQLSQLIFQLESGELNVTGQGDGVDVPVEEQSPNQSDETVTSPVVPDSDLLTPLNTVAPAENNSAEVNTAPSPEDTGTENVEATSTAQ